VAPASWPSSPRSAIGEGDASHPGRDLVPVRRPGTAGAQPGPSPPVAARLDGAVCGERPAAAWPSRRWSRRPDVLVGFDRDGVLPALDLDRQAPIDRRDPAWASASASDLQDRYPTPTLRGGLLGGLTAPSDHDVGGQPPPISRSRGVHRRDIRDYWRQSSHSWSAEPCWFDRRLCALPNWFADPVRAATSRSVNVADCDKPSILLVDAT
jgi:hypothetical protein